MTLDQRIGRETVVASGSSSRSAAAESSVVYRAESTSSLGRVRALKLLTPALGAAPSAQVPAGTSPASPHRSTIRASFPVYDAGEEDGGLYIAMACIEGGPT